MDARTRALLEAPILPTLLRLSLPNVAMMLVQAATGLIEAYFIGMLGTDALAGIALVLPGQMLMQMMSAGAMGGGVASAIARALGGGRRQDADALVFHALVVAVGFGLAFMAIVLPFGSAIYAFLGGRGAALEAALTYSNVLFAGIVVLWVFNTLANIIRGAGNTTAPALVTICGAVLLTPASAGLIFGWGPLPRMGIAGGACALLAYYTIGSLVLAAYIATGRTVLRPSYRKLAFRWALFADILRVGLISSLVSLMTNATIALTTSLVAPFGPAAIAGYGVGTRLEYLLVPLTFGVGGAMVALVGVNIGGGRADRAKQAAWVGAGICFAVTEGIGLAAAVFPGAWLRLFDSEPQMLEAGTLYLHGVGPFYGFFGLGMALYFASQGAGRLGWPLAANIARLGVATLGGLLVLRTTHSLTGVFLCLGAALVVFGSTVATAVALADWGRVGKPR